MALGDSSVKRVGTSAISVRGVEQTLKALRKLDKELFKESTDTIRSPLESAASIARSRYPSSGNALSGWRASKPKNPVPPKAFPTYRQNQAQQGVKVVVNKRTGKSARSYKVGALLQTNAGGVIFDMARNSPNNFGPDLMAKYGAPSRIMWPSMRAMQGAIVAAIKAATGKASNTIQAMMPKKSVLE